MKRGIKSHAASWERQGIYCKQAACIDSWRRRKPTQPVDSTASKSKNPKIVPNQNVENQSVT